MNVEQPNYLHDSLCEIVMRQEEMIRERDETIERQGLRMLEVALQNAALRQDAELLMSEEHERYAEVLILIENWIQARVVAEGGRVVDALALLGVFRDVFEYAEDGKEPRWFAAAVAAMGRLP